MPLFNIALLPTDETVNKRFVAFAQANFAETADMYLLGDSALPHLTLCQFRASGAQAAVEAFATWPGRQALAVTVGPFVTERNLGKVWAHFLVAKDPDLMSLQAGCYTHLAALGLETQHLPETYKPHFTMARLIAEPREVSGLAAWQDLAPVATGPQVGESSETGVYLRSLVQA